MKRKAPAWVEIHPFGEVLPYADNRVTVDESRTDRYGVPLMKIDYRIRENERKMVEHMGDLVEEMVKTAGGELVDYRRGETDKAGSAIHEHGTCRMGADPRRSALNAFNQMHEVKNVFVVDGSAFTTASEKNPTLTILALSWRATDYLGGRDQEGEPLGSPAGGRRTDGDGQFSARANRGGPSGPWKRDRSLSPSSLS